MKDFIIKGKMTGIVTNTRITHATPAALYAHTSSRYWEDDGKVPPASRKSCKDIARQLIEDDPGKNINVSFYYFFFNVKNILSGKKNCNGDKSLLFVCLFKCSRKRKQTKVVIFFFYYVKK